MDRAKTTGSRPCGPIPSRSIQPVCRNADIGAPRFTDRAVDEGIRPDGRIVGDLDVPDDNRAKADIHMAAKHRHSAARSLVANADRPVQRAVLPRSDCGIDDDASGMPEFQPLAEAVGVDLDPQFLAEAVLFPLIVPVQVCVPPAAGCIVQMILRLSQQYQVFFQRPVRGSRQRVDQLRLEPFRPIPVIVRDNISY